MGEQVAFEVESGIEDEGVEAVRALLFTGMLPEQHRASRSVDEPRLVGSPAQGGTAPPAPLAAGAIDDPEPLRGHSLSRCRPEGLRGPSIGVGHPHSGSEGDRRGRAGQARGPADEVLGREREAGLDGEEHEDRAALGGEVLLAHLRHEITRGGLAVDQALGPAEARSGAGASHREDPDAGGVEERVVLRPALRGIDPAPEARHLTEEPSGRVEDRRREGSVAIGAGLPARRARRGGLEHDRGAMRGGVRLDVWCLHGGARQSRGVARRPRFARSEPRSAALDWRVPALFRGFERAPPARVPGHVPGTVGTACPFPFPFPKPASCASSAPRRWLRALL